MAKLAKFLQGVAGAAGGAALNVEDVFSTYLYDGNSSTQTITNGIDLAGEGGLVWIKNRTTTNRSHILFDSERNLGDALISNSTAAETTISPLATPSFNSDGFLVFSSVAAMNNSGDDYASWTFRKAPKFFDVVTATSIGSTSRVLSHNLGCDVGFAVVKRLDSTSNWISRHRSLTAGHNINLNTTQASFAFSGIVSFDSTTITINEANFLGTGNYVVYLFAHNDGDGDFGPTGDQDIIKCGSFVQGTSSYDVDLGFEPQWVLIKSATSVTNWMLFDNMRGLVVGGNDAILKANTSAAEENTDPYLSPSATGFTSHLNLITGNQTYIYIAIRRGPMAVPESATDVFDINTMQNQEPTFVSNFVVDFALRKDVTGTNDWFAAPRLTQTKYLRPNATNSESSSSIYAFDYMDGWFNNPANSLNNYSWMWKRAPNFFDVVCYTGAGGIQTINHNLGVKPEAILIKQRTGTTNWVWWFDAFGDNQTFIIGNIGNATITNTTYFNNTAPTDTQITLGFHTNVSGTSSTNYIAYLFASLDGVSKIGSYTGNGTNQNIECGFSSGARFVLIKRTDGTGDWWVIDTERGLVAGADERLKLNATDVQVDEDTIDPYNGGFNVVQETYANLNVNNATYIFYAIA